MSRKKETPAPAAVVPALPLTEVWAVVAAVGSVETVAGPKLTGEVGGVTIKVTPHKEHAMTTNNAKDVAGLTAKMNRLREELSAVESSLESALRQRRDSPVDYIGKLIYANLYGDYGDTERARAQKVIDAAGGDLDIAERFVTEFHIR